MAVDSLVNRWRAIRQGLVQALTMLNDEQLSFSPHDGLRTLGQVACHIAEAEAGWVRYCLSQELDKWPSYQVNTHTTVNSLVTLLGEVHGHTETYLTALDEADLQREFRSPWGETLTPSDVIWHVMEHEIHHRGEIYLMLGMLDLKAPDI